MNHDNGRSARLALLIRLLVGLVLLCLDYGSHQTVVAAICRASGQAARRSATPKHSSAGSISGKVLADGMPAAEVSVSVTPLRQLTGSASFTAQMARTDSEETDDDGSFAVEGLAPGVYAVSIASHGYIVTSGLVDEDGKPIYYRPGDQVTIRMVKGGVITGKVIDGQGEPVVQAQVRAVRLRDDKGRPARANSKLEAGAESATTDDRGVYRIYGLEPGSYLVSAGGGQQFAPTPFANDCPVYHPSGTADVATEVKVQAAQETGGINISYSSIPGHSASGHLSGQFATGGMMSVAAVFLSHIKTGVPQAESVSMGDSHAYRLEGVPDGEYLVMAVSFSFGKDLTQAPPRRIVIKGSDVTGLDLTLGPITAISGKVVLQGLKPDDQKSGCKTSSPRRVEDIIVAPHASEKSKAAEQIPVVTDIFESTSTYATSADTKGEFQAQLPGGGSYHMETGLLDDDLFLGSVTLPADSAGKPPKDASGGVVVKNSERVAGVTVTVAQGAAMVGGRVVPAAASPTLPDRLRVYLAPIEKEAADNTLRYYDAAVRRDSSFEIKHLAPGRYYVVVRAVTQEEWDEVNPRPIWWGAASRQRLHQEAERVNNVIELKPCQQIKALAIPYAARASPADKS
jgi:hypothetical protein